MFFWYFFSLLVLFGRSAVPRIERTLLVRLRIDDFAVWHTVCFKLIYVLFFSLWLIRCVRCTDISHCFDSFCANERRCQQTVRAEYWRSYSNRLLCLCSRYCGVEKNKNVFSQQLAHNVSSTMSTSSYTQVCDKCESVKWINFISFSFLACVSFVLPSPHRRARLLVLESVLCLCLRNARQSVSAIFLALHRYSRSIRVVNPWQGINCLFILWEFGVFKDSTTESETPNQHQW